MDGTRIAFLKQEYFIVSLWSLIAKFVLQPVVFLFCSN